MKQFEYVITEPVGIHARPASLLVKMAAAYQSSIVIEKDGETADVKRLISIMALGIKNNEKILFIIDGTDETIAAKELEAFCTEKL